MNETVQWNRVKELFQSCLEQSPSRRNEWLAEECGPDRDLMLEVQRLLQASTDATDILDQDAYEVLARLHGSPGNIDRVGQRIGAYQLVRLIGEGGMGSVYLAERQEGDLNLRAALKLIRADFITDDVRASFLRERRILAQLTHPNIAQLHDGGMTVDGTPYFTLEYVDGEPITTYCASRALSIRDRLQLLLQVCAAVEFAHRNLIVHRDLKPSNIFVTADGQVKLLDFGIAKFLDVEPDQTQTLTQMRRLTPEYAAPEQVLGETITTAADVYSIGVLLYELLSGRLPYARADAGHISWSKAVIEEVPEPVYRAVHRPSARSSAPTGAAVAVERGLTLTALVRALRGDLDRILQRALAKSVEARYASVAALARDVRAHLQGRPISGGTRTYEARKFVRRHWLPLGAAAAILLTLMVSGVAVVWQAERTAHEARTTLAVKDFLFGLFTAMDPHAAKGREVSARELLDRGASRIERNKGLDAGEKAEIQSVLGRVYWQLGLFDQADKLQARALEALAATSTYPSLLARTETERAATLVDLGDLKSAAALAQDARDKIDHDSNASLKDRAEIRHVQAQVAIAQRDFVKTKQYSGEELSLVRQSSDVDSHALFRALTQSGSASWGLQQTRDAEVRWREALALILRDAGPDDLDVALARSDLAMALRSESHYAEARELDQQALDTDEKVLGPEHPITLAVRRDLALSNYRLGFYAVARSMMEQVIAAQRKKLGNDHPAIAGSDINLGNLLLECGDAQAAAQVLDESVSIFQNKYGRTYDGTRIALGGLAMAHAQLGKLAQADAELSELKIMDRSDGGSRSDAVVTDYRLGEVKRLEGDAAAAIALNRLALEESRKQNGESSRFTAYAHEYLGLALLDHGEADDAEREFRAALNSYAAYVPGAEHPLAATTRIELASLLVQREETRPEGIRLLEEAVHLREKFLGANDAKTQQARQKLRDARAASHVPAA